MRFEVWTTSRVVWCSATTKQRLETLGLQFGPANTHGRFPLIGPVTFRSDYGMETIGVQVEVHTLEALCDVLRSLDVVTIAMRPSASTEAAPFVMCPIVAEG